MDRRVALEFGRFNGHHMYHRAIWIWLCGASCLALVAVCGCNRSGGQGGFVMPPPSVTAAPVSVMDVPVYLDEIGKTTATEVVTVRPQISGKLTQQLFTDGADLQPAQALFTIDPRPFQAALDFAQASLEQNRAQLADAQTNFNRVASLLASKAVAQQDYDDKKNLVAVAQANVKSAEASLEIAGLNLEYCSITSPIEGRAGQALVDTGNVVNANATDLLVIQKISPIYVDFTIPETELDRVRQDMAQGLLKVQTHTQDDPQPPAEGTVQFLDNAVQDGTGTIKLRATILNKDRRFWPGQFVQVRLILATIPKALLIPAEAVQVGQQGPYVFVIGPDGKAEQRDVSPGQRQGDKVVITKGVVAGETVVRSGQLMVIPGMPVTVLKPATQPAGAVAAGAAP